eukprot:gb/GEZN01012773.1/.p1 GENE.gb/GEZN01012773.1/~~gb/GEZN01012773.1/.p1  ORF type:complete len:342 (-),score=25.33 gb/GEZN01012773.1/:30-998(-)
MQRFMFALVLLACFVLSTSGESAVLSRQTERETVRRRRQFQPAITGAYEKFTVEECMGLIQSSNATLVHVPSIGLDMFVYQDNDFVSSHVKGGSAWEPHVHKQITDITSSLPQDKVFLDIGANFGYFTLLAAKLGYEVYAFEALMANREIIQASLCLNHELRGRVRLYGYALAEVQGKCRIVSHPINFSDGLMICDDSFEVGSFLYGGVPYVVRETVVTARLDTLLPHGLRVDVLKIDVEGAEYLALQGAARLFGSGSRKPRIILSEVDDVMLAKVSNCSVNTYLTFLQSFSYKFDKFDNITRPMHLDIVGRCLRSTRRCLL